LKRLAAIFVPDIVAASEESVGSLSDSHGKHFAVGFESGVPGPIGGVDVEFVTYGVGWPVKSNAVSGLSGMNLSTVFFDREFDGAI
jgi:hypothetical protein